MAVFLPGESCGQRSLVGCSPRGRKDLTEQLILYTFTLHGRKGEGSPCGLFHKDADPVPEGSVLTL